MTSDKLIAQIEGTFLNEHATDLVDPIRPQDEALVAAWRAFKANASLGEKVREATGILCAINDEQQDVARRVRLIAQTIQNNYSLTAGHILHVIAVALEAEQKEGRP